MEGEGKKVADLNKMKEDGPKIKKEPGVKQSAKRKKESKPRPSETRGKLNGGEKKGKKKKKGNQMNETRKRSMR